MNRVGFSEMKARRRRILPEFRDEEGRSLRDRERQNFQSSPVRDRLIFRVRALRPENSSARALSRASHTETGD